MLPPEGVLASSSCVECWRCIAVLMFLCGLGRPLVAAPEDPLPAQTSDGCSSCRDNEAQKSAVYMYVKFGSYNVACKQGLWLSTASVVPIVLSQTESPHLGTGAASMQISTRYMPKRWQTLLT